jgi:hypothetical protein
MKVLNRKVLKKQGDVYKIKFAEEFLVGRVRIHDTSDEGDGQLRMGLCGIL